MKKIDLSKALVIFLLILFIIVNLVLLLKDDDVKTINLFNQEVTVTSTMDMRKYSWEDEFGLNVIVSYGYKKDYIIDIDNDGSKELICNCKDRKSTSVKVYKLNGDVVMEGVIRPVKESYKEESTKEYFSTQYDPKSNSFYLYDDRNASVTKFSYRAIIYHIYETPKKLKEDSSKKVTDNAIGV